MASGFWWGNPEETQGRPGYRWADNIMDLREVGWEGMDWIHLACGRYRWWAFVSLLMNIQNHLIDELCTLSRVKSNNKKGVINNCF